jgi:hypothetical protein
MKRLLAAVLSSLVVTACGSEMAAPPPTQEPETDPCLMAVQFGVSESCNTKRTLTVWKDEASMYQFVASPAHRRAMLKVGVMSRGGSIVTSWAGDERGATWSEAIEHLARETRPTY